VHENEDAERWSCEKPSSSISSFLIQVGDNVNYGRPWTSTRRRMEPARKKTADAHIGLLVGRDRNRRLRKHTPLLYREAGLVAYAPRFRCFSE